MPNQYFRIKSFKGGLSDWDDVGVSGSFKFGSNLDIRKNTDSLSCGYSLTDDLSEGTLDGLIMFIINCSDGNSYHATNTGKIYKRTSLGVYSLVYTDSGGAIKGLFEWGQSNGKTYIYWFTDTKMHSKEIPGASNWSDVDATIGSTTYPKTINSATWHIAKQINGNMYFLNGNKLGMVGYDSSYTDEALVFTPGNLGKSLIEYKGYAYIGCYKNDSASNAELFVWDAVNSLNWNVKTAVPSDSINALVYAEYPLMQVGIAGQVMLMDITKNSVPLFSFPNGGQVYPDAVEASEGLNYFGVFGNGTGNSGVYTYGRKKNNADPVLNLEYQLDCSAIGSVRKVGTDILISYANGSAWGVKKVSTNRATATYQSIDLLFPVSEKDNVLNKIRVVTAPLPSGTSIKCYRRLNKNGSFVQCNTQNGDTSFTTANEQEVYFLSGDKGKICEVELILTPSGTSTPEVYEIDLFFE